LNTFDDDSREFLRQIRGRFSYSRRERLTGRFYALLIGLCFAGFVYALFESGVPQWPFSANQWTFVILIIISPFLTVFLWFCSDREWEFTGAEVAERRRGLLRWRIAIRDITGWRIEHAGGGASWLHLFIGKRRYSVFIFPALSDQAQDLTRRCS
jgi:hypothetical protein